MVVPMNALDIIGTILSLLCTALLVRLNPAGWPMGLMANIVNASLFFKARLYADVVIEGIFFASSMYGWYYWLAGNGARSQSVKRLHKESIGPLSLATLSLFAVIYGVLTAYTDSTTPIIDAAGASLSIVAQCLIAKKYLENWYAWVAADALYGYAYYTKNLPFHVILMVAYLYFAFLGIRKWQEEFEEHRPLSLGLSPLGES